ncbi:large conductance mechanosensitive channel protein MscL, partial [Maribacter arcticus]
MLKEFKNFIMTGNVIDFAVAVILAGAVGLVVNGFVADIIMPVVGHFAGGIDFSQMKIVLDEAVVGADGAVTTPENAIRWGAWVNTIVNLIIVGFVMFIIVKAYNKTKTPPAPVEEAPKGPTAEEL